MIDFDKLLKVVVEQGASDFFITSGLPPSIKVSGRMMPMSKSSRTPEQAREMVHSTMNEAQIQEFESDKECNVPIQSEIAGRFRISAFYQRNFAGMVLRRIEDVIPSVDDLMLPEVIKTLAMTKRGLIIFVGATGTGKSTSLASMIGYRNEKSKGHIITIEDPIKYIHEHRDAWLRSARSVWTHQVLKSP
jgi:twitching motility protein PilU